MRPSTPLRAGRTIALVILAGASGFAQAPLKPGHDRVPPYRAPSPHMSAAQIRAGLDKLDPKLVVSPTGGAITFAAGFPGVVRRRVAGPQYAITHTRTLEYIIFTKGSATLVTGGTLIPPTIDTDPYPNTNPNATIRSASGVKGGLARQVGPGDIVVNPPGTPHWFSAIDGEIEYVEISVANIDPAPGIERAEVASAPSAQAPSRDATASALALTGQVSSAREGLMEGVLVSARKAGATQTITVVSDREGRYRFPRAKLEPGRYALRIRAIGYDLDGSVTADVAGDTTATADLKLVPTRDLAAQLTNAEWLASFPGTEEQRASVRGCAHCHTLQLVARSRHDANRFVSVVERMSGYPPLSFPLMVQRTPAARIGGGPASAERQQQAWRRQAEYLSTLNLSSGPQWSYTFKTLPRPQGDATRVVYTEFDLPTRTRQPHDVIVDSAGMVWYASFGEQILGKLDPKTGKVTEYEVPLLKPGAPTGILGMRFDEDENPWLGLQFQGGIAKFDRKTETFQAWSLPPELNGPHVQINQVSPNRHHVDGKVWLQDAGTYTILRLDVASGKFEVFEPYKIPRPNVYDVVPDSGNNGYVLPLGSDEIGRIDAKTGVITMFKTPTSGSGPRRGMMDSQDRLWFGENRADRIGMFDTRSRTFREWPAPTPGAWPYDVTADRTGDVWSGGEYNDRILRLNPATGRFLEYLLPSQTNVRRVFVDNSTNPVTFWVGNNHGASIVKLEPLDVRASTSSR